MADQTTAFFDRIKLNGRPHAREKNMVICGQARFTLLTERLIRLEWSATGQFEDRSTFAFPTRDAAPINFQQARIENRIEISTEFFTLHFTDTGVPFNPSNLSIALHVGAQSVLWTPGAPNPGNLRGTRRTLDQLPDAAPLSEGLLSRDGWALFDDSGSIVWDIDQTWVEARPEAHKQDWYFFGYGHAYRAALADYCQFGGPIPLIPRYVLGGWWSRFWPYHADDLKHLVQAFQAHDIPLDVLVVDMDWHTPDAWTGYTWNRKLFPDPTAFLSWAHSQKLHVTLNLHPAQGVQKHEEAYPRFAALYNHHLQNGEGIRFSPSEKAFIQPYFEILHHPMEDQGVDFWWLDWQQGDSSDLKGLDPLPWLNHLHFQDSTRRGMRPMLYSRWGGLGNHRYPIGFSGDTYATWEALRFQVYFTPTAANVGYGWWSHDIGGHFGATAPELYARWVQFGAVSPCLRLHATNDPLAERRPWAFPEPFYEAAKAAFQFRYRLLPYLYSAARDASQRGLSLCTPMYYEFPEQDDSYLARDQYFLGDQMFVAPITHPADPETGLAAFEVWIPPGTWIEYSTHEIFTGPRWIQDAGDLNRIPIFVKAGGILPTVDQLSTTQDFDGSHLILTVFPGADGCFQLYEDDGQTQAYQNGEYETTQIQLTNLENDTFSLTISAAEGQCSTISALRTLDLQFGAVNSPRRVAINGSDFAEWRYDPLGTTLSFTIPETDRRQSFTVVVQAESLHSPLHSAVRSASPFVHCLEYTVPDEARRQSGTIILVPPADGSLFEADIEWTLIKSEPSIHRSHIHLENCDSEQILHSPFADQPALNAYRWRVSVDIAWHGQILHFEHDSQTLRPSLNRWRMLIYDPTRQPLTIENVLTASTVVNEDLPWSLAIGDCTLNLKQPYGIILLEDERRRLLASEPLAACLNTTMISPVTQDAVLYVQCFGTVTAYLNGVPLALIDHQSIPTLQPMFYTWMPPTTECYRLPLTAGTNQLMLFTNPVPGSEWWGVGATLLTPSGDILTDVQVTSS